MQTAVHLLVDVHEPGFASKANRHAVRNDGGDVVAHHLPVVVDESFARETNVRSTEDTVVRVHVHRFWKNKHKVFLY